MKRILYVCGSLNQTTMMHKIAAQLAEYAASFTPYYADDLMGWMSQKGLLNFTILGGRHRQKTEQYLAEHQLEVDFGGKSNDYDLVVTGSDLIIQKNLRNKPVILIQEGMTDPEGWMYWLVRLLKLPRWLANTSVTGLSNAYDYFCVASVGYRDLFVRKGVNPEKIIVTGIPNFDDVQSFKKNNFPHRGYVLVATSPLREVYQWDDRIRFIEQAQRIAAGRKLIFKLHPNENFERATVEIRKQAPGALICYDGDINQMIANCDVLITQYSSVAFIGLALGKEVHSYFDLHTLRRLLPNQNGGASARRIAEVCRHVLNPSEYQRAPGQQKAPSRSGNSIQKAA